MGQVLQVHQVYQVQQESLLQLSKLYELESPDMVGLGGLEPPTSRLSGVRSNQLSYRPMVLGCSCLGL